MPRRRRCCVGLRRRLVKRLPRLACRRRGLYQASIHSKMALATTSGFGQVRMSSSSRCMLDQNDSIMLATRPCCRAGQLPAAGDRRSNLCTDCRGRPLADCSGPGPAPPVRSPSELRRRRARSACGRRRSSRRPSASRCRPPRSSRPCRCSLGARWVLGDVGRPQPVGAGGGELARTRSSCGAGSGRWPGLRRWQMPLSPALRIRRATRLRPSRSPSPRSSAWTRGALQDRRDMSCTSRSVLVSTASAPARGDGGRDRAS